jgi:hypothetical protein
MDLLWLIENGLTSEPITGSFNYTNLVIRRETDGYLLDWGSESFAVSGGIIPSIYYDEVSSSVLPGLYKRTIDISTWDNGTYHAISYFNTPEFAANRVEEFIIIDGAKCSDTTNADLREIKNSIDVMSAKIKEPPAGSLLAQEYYNNQDADGNNLIYGIDFYITVGRPKMLNTIPKRGIPMTWAEYLNSIT